MRAATQSLNCWATPSPTLPRAGGGRSVAVASLMTVKPALTPDAAGWHLKLPPPARGRFGEGVRRMPVYRNDGHRVHARVLRASMTPAEAALWQVLRAHRFMGLSVRRQAPLGPWIVDFVIPSRRFVIELLDETHDRAVDRAPAAGLAILGYRCVYLRPSDVLADLPAILHRLAEEIGQ